MATKLDFTYQGKTKQAYKEGPLILWQNDDDSWTVVHEQSGLSACGEKLWSKKRDAMAFAQALIDYEEEGKRIIWDCSMYDVFYQVNDEEFIMRAWLSVKDM